MSNQKGTNQVVLADLVTTTVMLICSKCRSTYNTWPIDTQSVVGYVMRSISLFRERYPASWERMTKEDLCLVIAKFTERAEDLLRDPWAAPPVIKLKARFII